MIHERADYITEGGESQSVDASTRPFDRRRLVQDNRLMRIIDAHSHILPGEIIAQREAYRARDAWFGRLYADPRQRLANAEDLIAALDEAGVSQAVAFGFAFRDDGLCRLCNDYTLAAARRHPARLISLAVVNPARPQAVGEARRCLEAGARGVGELLPDGQGFALDDGLDELMALLRAWDAPLLLHVNEPLGHDYAGKGAQGPAQAHALAQRYPHNDIILAHWGGGLPFYELMPEVRQALARVYYDTAASLYLYEDAIFRHVAAWAAPKILFGSDYPLLAPRRCLRRIRRVGLTVEREAQLLGGNLARLLRLPADSGED